MGWISDDGLHEGYLEAVLYGDKRVVATTAAGPVVVTQTAGELEYETRSDDEVIGWQLRCDCRRPEASGVVSRWKGPMFERVATATLEDLEDGRIFVGPDDFAAGIDERQDVGDYMRSRWLREHVAALEALANIRAARRDLEDGRHRLDEAARVARTAGESWAAIGLAAGISRQSAQERWGLPRPRRRPASFAAQRPGVSPAAL